jgi:fructose-1,6-bisphosphatase/sedoheptulose 1,7-bisphosphatase-like protein
MGAPALTAASVNPTLAPDASFVWHALASTREAAVAAAAWTGRGDPHAADEAATAAMRKALAAAPATGVVVTGEGAKDDAPMLADGELTGGDLTASFDIAVDPLECTELCARGLPGALSTIAVAPRGSLGRRAPPSTWTSSYCHRRRPPAR